MICPYNVYQLEHRALLVDEIIYKSLELFASNIFGPRNVLFAFIQSGNAVNDRHLL